MNWTRTLKKYWWVCAAVVVAVVIYSRSGFTFNPVTVPESTGSTRRGPIGHSMGSAPYKGGSVQSDPEALRNLGGSGGYGPQAACCSACGHSGGTCSD
jgi:hypothetical protein